MIYSCEAEVPEGLESIAREEIQRLLGKHLVKPGKEERGAVRFDFRGNLRELLALRTVQAVYLRQFFPVPRPRALMGDQHFRALLQQIATIRALESPEAYRTFYISAAGSDSSVMTRLKQELTQATGLKAAAEEGDLLIRLRRSSELSSRGATEGWETLIRLSPRPLSTRSWRVCNLEGALNASVAQAMVILTRPSPSDVYLNLGCGSATLMIERMACGGFQRIIGCDTSESILDCARSNIAAAGGTKRIDLLQADGRTLPLPDRSVDALCADLPFGQLMGSHEENARLYPALLSEAARVLKPGAPCVVITHEIRLMDKVLRDLPQWQAENTLRVTLRGLHPRIYVLTNQSI
jgi:23S rRNA G2445 N2-methylase RlmL